MIQRVTVISFTIMDKCGIVEWSTNCFKVTFSPFCYFSRIIGYRADVFADPSSLLRCRYNGAYQWNVLFCGLLISYLIENVIETNVVDLDSDYVRCFATIFFIAIGFFLENSGSLWEAPFRWVFENIYFANLTKILFLYLNKLNYLIIVYIDSQLIFTGCWCVSILRH